MKNLFIVLFCMASVNAKAQLIDTVKKDLFTAPDTVQHLHSKFPALVVPAAFVGYGALSLVFHPIRQLDYNVNRSITKADPHFNFSIESYLQFAPLIAVYGLNLIGDEGKNRFVDRTALYLLSEGIAGVTVFAIKYPSHRLRPNGTDYLSFPSAHTASAFAAAEFMAQEYGDKSIWYTVAGYGFATVTGAFRIYDHDHWLSDVVAGAGIGIASAKVAYWLYPYIRNKFTHNGKKPKNAVILPTFQNGAAGLSLAKQF